MFSPDLAVGDQGLASETLLRAEIWKTKAYLLSGDCSRHYPPL